MIYCINPLCNQRQNPPEAITCNSCGNPLLIKERIRLLRPLREDPYSNTEVFEVEDAGTKWNPGRKIRIMKILKWVDDPKRIELMQRESLALQAIHHKSVPDSTIDDYFTFSPENTPLELHCLIMEKFSGEDLESWLMKSGKISQKLALDWLKQLVEILDEVHRSTFFHRDIKPSNIIVQDNGQLALIDFGGARRITATYLAKISINGGNSRGIGSEYQTTRLGTPGYSPLEQIDGQAVPQSDFYSLGRTMIRLLTGEELYNFKTKDGKLQWRHKASDIDAPFADLLDNLIAPFPSERPQNATEILHRLKRLPLQSKFHRLVKSKPLQISAVVLIILSIFGIYRASLPWVANYYFYLASRQEKNRPELARKNYELAIRFHPQDVDTYNNLALVCQQLRDFECAQRNYQSVLKLNPNNWSSHYGLGNFYDEQGKYDLAQQQYQLAIQKSNNTAVVPLNNLSRLLNRKGEYNAAETLAQQGLQKTLDQLEQAALYKNLGWAAFEQKQYAIAKTHLEKAIRLDSTRIDAYCLLAQAQEALSAPDDARVSWEVCLVSDSSLPEVQTWRQQLLKRLLK